MIYSKLLPVISIAAATVFTPVSAGIHDFNTENRTAAPSTRVGSGQCVTTRDQSKVCYVKLPNNNFSIAIHDVDSPGNATAAFIDCKTGRWNAMGNLTKQTLDLYLNKFCPTFG